MRTSDDFFRKLQTLRFFTFSLAIHLVLGVLLGSVVIFKAVLDDKSFIIPDAQAGFFTPEEEAQAEPAAESSEFEEVAAPAEVSVNITQTLASAVVAIDPIPASFQMATSSTAGTGISLGGTLQPAAVIAKTSLAGSTSSMGAASFLGVPQVQGVDGLIGTLYDLKQTKDRQPTGLNPDQYGEIVADFVRGWNPVKLRRFYRASTLLMASQVFTPEMPAGIAPKAFGVEKEVEPMMWLVWYRARVSPPKTGNYHFVGAGDDIMFVKFNGRTVLDRCWFLRTGDVKEAANYDYGFSVIKDGFAKGRAFRAEAGKFYDLDILIGEQPGGLFFASLLLEEAGATYQKDAKGNPILPIFRVGENPTPLEDGRSYPPYAESGPVWSVQAPSAN